MLRCDPVDHLLDEHRLTHTGTTEEADLATLHIGLEKVDDLDAGLEHLGARLKLDEGRRVAVDVPTLLDLTDVRRVEGLAQDVEDVAQHDIPDGHRDASSGVAHHSATDQPVGGLHAHATHSTLTDLLGHLTGHRDLGALEVEVHLHGHVDLRQRVRRELHVDDRASDGHDASGLQLVRLRGDGHSCSFS